MRFSGYLVIGLEYRSETRFVASHKSFMCRLPLLHSHELFDRSSYVNHRFAYVFNGLLRGVKLERPVEGHIGAQRIWRLLQAEMATLPIHDKLASTMNRLMGAMSG